jgi:hypothetical protein
MLDAESKEQFQRLPILPLRVRIKLAASIIYIYFDPLRSCITLLVAYILHTGRIVLYILFLRTFLSDLSIF